MKISVITPVYNAEPYLEKAVLSALEQAEVEEVLLIEDGSTDKSLAVCERLVTTYEKVKLFRHKNGINKGAGATRNLGLEHVGCDFVAFLDADDFYLPNRFKEVNVIFQNKPDAQGVYEAIAAHFYSDKARELYNKSELTTLAKKDITPFEYFESLCYHKGFTSLDGITVRTELIKKVGWFDQNLKQSQDTDFIRRMALAGKFYGGSVDKPVTMRGVHESNRIHDKNQAKKYAGQLAYKWLKMSFDNDWPAALNYKFFFRTIAHRLDNKNKRILALKLLLKHPKIFGKVSFKDLVYGFKTNFT